MADHLILSHNKSGLADCVDKDVNRRMFTENPEIKGSESREAPKEQDHHSIYDINFNVD